jgi:hypothetical protein
MIRIKSSLDKTWNLQKIKDREEHVNNTSKPQLRTAYFQKKEPEEHWAEVLLAPDMNLPVQKRII